MKRYGIIGFGCAGYHALSSLRECSPDAEIHVYSDLNEAPANPMLTTYYAAGRLPYEGLFPFGSLDDIQKRFSPILHPGTAVTAIDPEKRIIMTSDGSSAVFDAILLATGADPFVPPLGVTVGNRVLCMRTVSDAKALHDRLAKGDIHSVTVIGGSMVGIKIIELCWEAGLKCTLADMAPNIFPLAAFPEVSREIMDRLEQKGIVMRFGTAVTGASEGEKSVITSFADGDPVESDLLVLCIGTRARTALARESGIEVNRGIVVDDRMATSVPGIYAAGDCCEGRNVMSGGNQIIGLWANAACQGQVAGCTMAGQPAKFSGNILHNITHYMGMDFISFGDIRAQGQVYTIGKPSDKRYVKAIVSDGELRCVNMLDSYRISGVIKNYIMNRFTGNKNPLPISLRGMLAREGFTDEFLALFEGNGLCTDTEAEAL